MAIRLLGDVVRRRAQASIGQRRADVHGIDVDAK
jgi:hypothetical protein